MPRGGGPERVLWCGCPTMHAEKALSPQEPPEPKTGDKCSNRSTLQTVSGPNFRGHPAIKSSVSFRNYFSRSGVDEKQMTYAEVNLAEILEQPPALLQESLVALRRVKRVVVWQSQLVPRRCQPRSVIWGPSGPGDTLEGHSRESLSQQAGGVATEIEQKARLFESNLCARLFRDTLIGE